MRAPAVGLGAQSGRRSGLVLALSRGAVPVAYEVAVALRLPLDVLLVRRLGLPGREEIAMGAIASGRIGVLDEETVRVLAVPGRVVDAVIAREARELEQSERQLRGGRKPARRQGRAVILVDEGATIGSTVIAAVEAVRREGPSSITVALPVASVDAYDELKGHVPAIACVYAVPELRTIAPMYAELPWLSDDEVHELLDRAAKARGFWRLAADRLRHRARDSAIAVRSTQPAH